MKVRKVVVRHFKRFEHLEVNLVDEVTQSARDFVVLVGQNGAGKTTVLQAIAASLGTITGRLRDPSGLGWQGYELELAGRNWDSPPMIEVELEFSEQELQDTADMVITVDPDAARPHFYPRVTVRMEGNHVTCEPREAKWQFHGRRLATQLAKTSGAYLYQNAGHVYWYKDQRNLRSVAPSRPEERNNEPINTLRMRLMQWQFFHERVSRGEYPLKPEERDLYARFQEVYRAIFPNRQLIGSVPDSRVGQVWNDPLFLLHDGQREYELGEISGGERAVFPILFDFLNFEVNRSVVLIDEFELHLHPPMQQALMRALRALGKENQFIVTTHSNSVVNVLPPEHVVWLKESKQ